MFAACLALAILNGPASACATEDGSAAKAVTAVDGETVLLDDGSLVRLVGALAPSAPAWWKKPEPWRAADRARAALAELVEGREVILKYSGDRTDRRERVLAQVYVRDGSASLWVQRKLVEEGNARVYSLAGNRACASELLAAEASARARKAGLWSDSHYAVADPAFPDRILKRLYSYELVEGTVRAVAETRNWVFLNFSADWRRDFTVAIAASHKGAFAEAGYAFADLKGRRIRARGWIERWNGPVIKATHPEQIEVLDDGTAGGGPDRK
ncbi:MAG: thermonuclease family protein [Hyphomicrobiales bacterium]